MCVCASSQAQHPISQVGIFSLLLAGFEEDGEGEEEEEEEEDGGVEFIWVSTARIFRASVVINSLLQMFLCFASHCCQILFFFRSLSFKKDLLFVLENFFFGGGEVRSGNMKPPPPFSSPSLPCLLLSAHKLLSPLPQIATLFLCCCCCCCCDDGDPNISFPRLLSHMCVCVHNTNS